MGLYDRLQNTAQKLIKDKGQTVTLTHVDPGTYDPTTGGYSGGSTTTQYGYGAVIDWNANQIDGTLIKTGDRRLLLSPLNTAGAALTSPVLNDKITDAAGVVYTFVAPLNIVSPAGTPVLYDCNLRV
jgi:hypothetical protein